MRTLLFSTTTLLAAAWCQPALADNGLGHGYFAAGAGPAIGNDYGGVVELEVGGGSDGSYFAGLLHGFAGSNWDGSLVYSPGLALGYRGVLGRGPTRFTFFAGPMALYKAEIWGGQTYHYTVGWGRVHLGFLQGGNWGVEAGIGLGYQHHWAENTGYPDYWPDYSGFAGSFDVQWRLYL